LPHGWPTTHSLAQAPTLAVSYRLELVYRFLLHPLTLQQMRLPQSGWWSERWQLRGKYRI